MIHSRTLLFFAFALTGAACSKREAPPPYVLSDGAKRVLAQAAVLRAGMPADFDGDGTAEFVPATDANGVLTVTVDRDGDGRPEFTYSWDAKNGTGVIAADADQDGVHELEINTSSSPTRRVILKDDDLDGTMERRVTETLDETANTIHVVTEQLDAGSFVVASDTTISAVKQDGAEPCEGHQSGFPKSAAKLPLPGSDDRINTRVSNDSSDGSKGECSDAHAKDVAAAMDCVMSQGLGCLRDTNSSAAAMLEIALSTGSLDVSCGNKCQGVGASTAPSDNTMTFNPDRLGKQGAAADCARMLHEMMHWAGVPDDDATHGKGTDEVYSCARYCGGCVEGVDGFSPSAAVTKNSDCAECSDTSDRRGKCGSLQKKTKSQANYMICHNGLACVLDNCADPTDLVTTDCSGRNRQASEWCCNQCPTGCDMSNDLPCTEPPVGGATCTGATPFCK